MTTSSAEANGYRCPQCGDDTKHDHAGRGFVPHKHNPYCSFERGLKDS